MAIGLSSRLLLVPENASDSFGFSIESVPAAVQAPEAGLTKTWLWHVALSLRSSTGWFMRIAGIRVPTLAALRTNRRARSILRRSCRWWSDAFRRTQGPSGV